MRFVASLELRENNWHSIPELVFVIVPSLVSASNRSVLDQYYRKKQKHLIYLINCGIIIFAIIKI